MIRAPHIISLLLAIIGFALSSGAAYAGSDSATLDIPYKFEKQDFDVCRKPFKRGGFSYLPLKANHLAGFKILKNNHLILKKQLPPEPRSAYDLRKLWLAFPLSSAKMKPQQFKADREI